MYLSSRSTVTDCFMLCFGLDNKASFEHLQRLLSHISKVKKSSTVILVGCKSDLSETAKVVTPTQIENFTATYNLKYFETSAKNNLGVKESFEYVLRAFLLLQKEALDKSKKAAYKMSLLDACACEAIFPKVVKKKIRSNAKPSPGINEFIVRLMKLNL